MVPKLLPAVAFLAAAVAVSVADDKPTDWSKFATGGTVVGEVVKADGDGLTLRISWLAPSNSGRSRGRGGRPVQGKEQHVDYDLSYAEGGLVRWKALPQKTDEKGKKIPLTSEEKTARKKPQNVPGYSAERTELVPGHIVELTLVRSRDVPAAKATMDDMQVKYAMIVGESPTPPKADRDEKKGPPKKDDKKKDDKKDEKKKDGSWGEWGALGCER